MECLTWIDGMAGTQWMADRDGIDGMDGIAWRVDMDGWDGLDG